MKTSLLKIIEDEVQTCNTKCNEKIGIFMDDNLEKVIKLAMFISFSRMITIRDLARKK